jgi:glucose/arabinose dehydrogenase
MALRILLAVVVVVTSGCATKRAEAADPSCRLVDQDFGPAGTVGVKAEEVVSGLEVPWGLAFLPNGDMLVTERPGRVRLVQSGKLVVAPVATIAVSTEAESGLLGIALHPDFATNRFFYLYETVNKNGSRVNRVERMKLSADGLTAASDKIIFDDASAAQYHDGGRIRFGPDGMLYVGVGDAREPDVAQNPNSPNGKILRLTPEGAVPSDNPTANNPAFLHGVRNTQGFDWLDPTTLAVSDHGPSGDTGRTGHDELNVAKAGMNLGWPTIYACETRTGMVTPRLTWTKAAPPGGLAVYRGTAIPEWTGSILIGTLSSQHLQRVVLDATNSKVSVHEVYFKGELGRLREVIVAPDGSIYVTTSNCDGRGSCPATKDRVLRIVKG